MSNSGCPTHRKGAMKAALSVADGELEPRPERGEPVEATGYDDLLEKLSEKALRVLEEDLSDSDTRARQEAARCIIQARSKRAEIEKPEPTTEEREAQLEAALATPKLREFLEARGWVAPMTGEKT